MHGRSSRSPKYGMQQSRMLQGNPKLLNVIRGQICRYLLARGSLSLSLLHGCQDSLTFGCENNDYLQIHLIRRDFPSSFIKPFSSDGLLVRRCSKRTGSPCSPWNYCGADPFAPSPQFGWFLACLTNRKGRLSGEGGGFAAIGYNQSKPQRIGRRSSCS
ncbi:hypothetical protein N656DRAFT_584296 [Canariomyces notabilis]|uniref:Uncharacterized protein n=1 Tax=Canariomyces notabilis TaxID=2074819 RepID=A0AAN6YVA3_9PEZI|nr:hypothetical protein N656DRAFT_584296 [Canariomyces arenarius]